MPEETQDVESYPLEDRTPQPPKNTAQPNYRLVNAEGDGTPSDSPEPEESGWNRAFGDVRERASRFADRLGRHSDDGDALNAALHPEEYGATEDMQMVDVMDEEMHRDAYQSKLQNSLEAEAMQLAHNLGITDTRSSDQSTVAGENPNGGGVLSHLLKQYGGHRRHFSQSSLTLASEDETPGKKGKQPKQKWYNDEEGKKKKKKDKQVKLTAKIGAVLTRQHYIIRLCRALMKYGAPTHRLEEYMKMTSNVLGLEAQFLYLPGCMIMSFEDPFTRTAEVKVVRAVQGLDLGRLAATHIVYKKVVHEKITVDQANKQLDELMERKNRYHKTWVMVILSGLASVAIGPWAFNARPIDMPIIFLMGCLLGVLQHILAPASPMYSNVFEVSVAILMSFLARAFGSIRINGEYLFCFPAMAQSSIALILPGYSVLCSSLELQSHQIVAGSIRLVYTVIYSLFLGYGVTVGITLYGAMDGNATKESSCPASSLEIYGNEYIQHFVFVAVYCAFAGVLNQAKWKQIPVMVLLGVCGYITNYFGTNELDGRLGSTMGAFTIGLLANLYSRLWHGHAAAVIVPGMFTLVSSGLAASGSILSGLAYSEAVRNNTANDDDSSTTSALQKSLSGLGISMVQTALAVTVGLFMSALVVYPSGKKRSGLFNL